MKMFFNVICLVFLFHGVAYAMEKCRTCDVESQTLLKCAVCKNANYCSKKCQKEDWVKHKCYCQHEKFLKGLEKAAKKIQIHSLEEGDPKYSGASGQKERGVFAVETILKSEVPAITQFPGTLVEESQPESLYRVKQDREACLTYAYMFLNQQGKEYNLVCSEQEGNDLENQNAAAHLINDPNIEFNDLKTLLNVNCSALEHVQDLVHSKELKKIQGIAEKYIENEFSSRSNVTFAHRELGLKNQYFVYVAPLRDLLKGEELLVTYGLHYWIQRSTNICLRKGFPRAAEHITRATSQGVEKYSRANLKHLKDFSYRNLYQGYVSHDVYRSNLKVYLNRYVESQLAGLFAGPAVLNLHVAQPEVWNQILQSVAFKEQMKQIQQVPNEVVLEQLKLGHHLVEAELLLKSLKEAELQAKMGNVFWFFFPAHGDQAPENLYYRDLIKLFKFFGAFEEYDFQKLTIRDPLAV